MVRSQIKKKSKIILVIDQPSAEDDSNNKLMTDKMMKMVGSYLAQANIHLSSISIIPVVKERHNKLKNISMLEKTAWKALLEREINTIPEVNLIICLGELATEMLTGKSNHDKYRGSIMPCKLRDCKTLVLWNPTHASDPKTPWLTVYMARPEWKPFMSWDCQKAKRHKDTPEYLHPGCEIIVTEDLALLEKEFLSDEYINNDESKLACDIEASYAEMTCIGFAKDETKAYVIPLVHMNGKKLSQALKLTDRILSSPVKKIFQNGNFDLTFLAHYYKIKVNNFWWDTMLCFHSMFPNLPKGLGVLGSLFTETPYWKDMAKGEDDKQWMMPHHKVDWPTFFRYNGEDTANLITIQKNQQPILDSRGTHEVFQREMNLCYPLITSEVMGTNIDLSIKTSLRDKLENEIRKWELFFHHLCMENAPNINSPKQLKEFLYEKLRLPTRVKKGSVTADVDALTSLIKFNPIVIKPIMILRILKKQRSFCDITTAEDGRVRTTFKPAGTQTGRLSSSKSLTGVGSNLQQIPKIAKSFYIPDEGKVLVQADYSKAESWIVAALAEDEKMIEALYSEDFHSTNATNILGYKVTKANYSDRQLGKRISHGSNYGMTSFLLQSVLAKEGYAFNKKETEELMEMYFNNYPGVRHNYHNWIKDCLRANMTLENPFGRKTTFFDQWGNRLFNKAFAWIPQSTIGDMAGQAWINTYNKMGHYVDIMIQVHDSLVMQVDKENLTQDFIDELSSCMIIPLDIKGTHIEVPIDVEVGHNWKDLIEWHPDLSGGFTECGKCGMRIEIGKIAEDKEFSFVCKECPE